MKKIITLSAVSLFLFVMNFAASAQDDYTSKKKAFWEQYQIYKSNVDKNIFTAKPTDASGLFEIDGNNNFAVKGSSSSSTLQPPFVNSPWLQWTTDAVNTYTWTQDTTTYIPIATGTWLASSCDDGAYSGIPIGFTFVFDGVSYTTVGITCNGWINMGSTVPSTSYNPISTGITNNVISAFGADLYGLAAGDSLRYITSGTSPNRVFTVEWWKWGFYSTGLNEISFQIKIYETSNIIEFIYQPTTPTTTRTIEVGLRGASNADFNNRTTACNWSATTGGTANSASCQFTSSCFPVNGLRFRWTPCTAAYTYGSSTATQTNTSPVYAPSTNVQILGVEVVVSGCVAPVLNATSFTFNTAGSTNPGTDISRAKLWYTGTSGGFAANNQFGSTFTNPNGSFTITGTQALATGTNYFWLTYDVKSGATIGDTLDAQCNSLIVGDTSRTPTVQSPAGYRVIAGTAMSGVYSIPGNFANFTAAIGALNTRGIAGPVTFNVQAGFIDTAANLVLNTTGTASNPIIFQRVGTSPTPNPVIIAGTGVGSLDGIIILNGADYVTFDGINLMENPANTTTTTQMEWGYALLKPDGTNGCQYVTIKNCSVTLNKTNTSTRGIYLNNHSPTSTATFVVSTVAGANSYNSILNDSVSNCYSPIWLNGYLDGTIPYSFMDLNNTVDGNTLTNWGGSSIAPYGIYCLYQRHTTVSNNTINSAGGTHSTSTMYGMYFATNYQSNLTVSNNTVSLVNTGTTGTIYGIYMALGVGNMNTVNVLNNTVTVDYSTATSGAMYYIYSSNPARDLTISGNRIVGSVYGTSAATGTTIYGIYNLSSVVNSITITNNLDSGNVVNGTTSYSLYRIYNGVAAFNITITGNRIKNNTIGGTTASATSYGIYNTGGTFSANVSNNEVRDNVFPSTSSHSFYHIFNSVTTPQVDLNNNVISGTSGNGSGTWYGLYNAGTPGAGSTVNMNNNMITNLSKLTATGTGSIFGIYQAGAGAGTYNLNNNTVTGLTSAAATTLYGIYQIGSILNYLNINNNTVGNLTNAGATAIYGIYSTASTVITTNNPTTTIQNDSVFNISSQGSTVYGMLITGGYNWDVSRNRISGVSSTVSTSGIAYGLYSSVATGGANVNVYNNFISDVNAPASTSTAPAVAGIYVASGASNTYYNFYYNTVYIQATSTGTTFSTAALYMLTTPVLDMRNNILIDKSTPGTSGGNAVAYRRSSTTLTTYSSLSNNNCLFAGTPAANRLIYFDGVNSDQTLAAYKTRVIPRDNNSITENVPFVNGTTPPYNLRLALCTSSGVESGAQIITSPIVINTDIFGTNRYPQGGAPACTTYTPTAPDIGAYEYGGVAADLIGPYISYTQLGNGGVAATRTFSGVVITDQSGVNITGPTRPRCYYKKSSDANAINDSTSATAGWKYVLSDNTTSPFTFTIDYSRLFGGTGVVAGDVIQYFVIAQDLAGTPNVSALAATFNAAPTSVILASGNAPISNTYSYTIVANTFSGSVNVGTAQTYTSLTNAGGLFAAINAGVLSGNLTVNITSDLVEDGTNALNQWAETGAGGYRIRFVPSSASVKTISGSVAQGMIRFNGADRVTFDGGSFFASAAPGKYLTFRNTNGSNPTIQFLNDAKRDSIIWCNIESNNISTATTTSGTIHFGTTTGTDGNDSNVVAYCDIRDRSDLTGTPVNGIYCNGTTTTRQQYNNWITIRDCNIFNNFYDYGGFQAAIYLNTGADNWMISNNSFYQTTARTSLNANTFISIFSNTTNNNDIQAIGNFIGGSAPLCGGSPMTYTGTGLYNVVGIYLFVGILQPSGAQGNTITNIDLTTSPASGSSGNGFFRAIWGGGSPGWVNIGDVTGNTIGAATGNGAINLTTNTTASSYAMYIIYATSFGNISNNTIGSITWGGTSTGTGDALFVIYSANTQPGWTYNFNNNLIGSLTTPHSIKKVHTSTGASIRGLFFTNGAGTTNNVTNNVVANITDSSTSSLYTTSVYGIQNNGGAGWYNFTGNVVRNLTINTNVPTTSFMLGGIFSTGAGINTYTQNTIYSLYARGTGAGYMLVGGILAGGTTGGVVSRNKIYDFRFDGTGSLPASYAPQLLGINVQSSGQYMVSNNMVSITNGDLSLDELQYLKSIETVRPNVQMRFTEQEEAFISELSRKAPKGKREVVTGISDKEAVNTITPVSGSSVCGMYDASDPKFDRSMLKQSNREGREMSPAPNGCILTGVFQTGTSALPYYYYYNTMYIGGTQPSSSTLNSWTWVRFSGLGAVEMRNNLLINARTGGTGAKHYVVGHEVATPQNGWTPTSGNYNVYLGSDASTIGEWGIGVDQTIDQWRGSTGGDKQTWSTTTSALNVLNLLNSIGTGDLTIRYISSEAWIVSGKGIALAGQNVDYQGDPRATTISGGCTDIGADEFTQTPPSNPTATQVGTPGSGATTTYRLYGRTIAQIDWGTGGTSYPTTMSVVYNSGINPSPNITNPNRTSNSNWVITIGSGTLAGALYDLTLFFGDNETYTITSPATNVLLAKYGTNTPFWQVFPPGNTQQTSQLDWGNLQITTRGLNTFSSFALSDAALPAITLVSPPHNSIRTNATDTLVWQAAAGSTGYRVQMGTDSTFNTGIIVNDSLNNVTTRVVTGLVNNQRYFWRVRGTNGIGTGTWGQIFKFTVNTVLPPAIVNLAVIPGGFYNTGSGRLNMKDTVRVYLVDSSGCTRMDSNKVVIDSVTFSAGLSFANAPTGNYYIFVFHRNHLAISSRLTYGVVRGGSVSYDFTTDSAKAYGYNMIKVSTSPVRWGMIPGDANRDYFVDGLDQTIWIAQNGLDGYLSADFNGDLFVDGLDQTIWIIFNGQSAVLPCWFDHPVVQREPTETRMVKLKEAQEKILKLEVRSQK